MPFESIYMVDYRLELVRTIIIELVYHITCEYQDECCQTTSNSLINVEWRLEVVIIIIY